MSDPKTVIKAPQSDFTASSGSVNYAILLQELGALSLSVGVENVTGTGTDVNIYLAGLASTADMTAIDAAIAAHVGDAFALQYQSDSAAEDVLKSEANITASDSTLVEVYSYDSGVLQKAPYQILWSAEHKVSAESADDDSEILIEVDLGGGFVEINSDSTQSSKFRSFSNGMVLDRLDGQRIKVKMSLRKTGTGSAQAVLRRARVVHFSLD